MLHLIFVNNNDVCHLRPLSSRLGSPLDLLDRFFPGVLSRPKHKHWSDVADQSF